MNQYLMKQHNDVQSTSRQLSRQLSRQCTAQLTHQRPLLRCLSVDQLLLLKFLTTLFILFTHLSPARSFAQELFDVPAPSAPVAIPKGPLTLPLLAEYRGEQERGVRYINAQERSLYRVIAHNGRLLYAHNKRPLNEGHATPHPRPHKAPHPAPSPKDALAQGYGIYVLSPQGTLYVSFEAETHRVHHSSLLAGGPVQCAGELIVFNGELVALNNKSGHYRPPPKALTPLLALLKAGGVNLDRVHVERVGLDL
jgi:hypothetical protein